MHVLTGCSMNYEESEHDRLVGSLAGVTGKKDLEPGGQMRIAWRKEMYSCRVRWKSMLQSHRAEWAVWANLQSDSIQWNFLYNQPTQMWHWPVPKKYWSGLWKTAGSATEVCGIQMEVFLQDGKISVGSGHTEIDGKTFVSGGAVYSRHSDKGEFAGTVEGEPPKGSVSSSSSPWVAGKWILSALDWPPATGQAAHCIPLCSRSWGYFWTIRIWATWKQFQFGTQLHRLSTILPQ